MAGYGDSPDAVAATVAVTRAAYGLAAHAAVGLSSTETYTAIARGIEYEVMNGALAEKRNR